MPTSMLAMLAVVEPPFLLAQPAIAKSVTRTTTRVEFNTGLIVPPIPMLAHLLDCGHRSPIQFIGHPNRSSAPAPTSADRGSTSSRDAPTLLILSNKCN